MTAYVVTIVSPPGYIHSAAFFEVAETLVHGLSELGHRAILSDRADIEGFRPIVLGANLLPKYPVPLPPDAILYNLEQIDTGVPWMQPEMLDLFRRRRVWDYSERNAARLVELGICVSGVLPIGYAPSLTRIEHREPDIDVLFVGSFNPRRNAVLLCMQKAGLRVQGRFGAYMDARDALIARSKLVLNVHFYEARVLEMVRISYLLANRCAVLSERSADPDEDATLDGGVAFADYDELTDRAIELVNDSTMREAYAARGFELMRARPIAPMLAKILQGART